jgi:hypothetical protein
MKYINTKSNRGVVNKLADHILSKINSDQEYNSVIEVTDCGKFFVVNGMTNSNEVLDMPKIADEFTEQNKELLSKFGYEHINSVDLIMYDVEMESKTDYWFTFYNTERPSYSQNVINFVKSTSSPYWSVNYTDKLHIEYDYSVTPTLGSPQYSYSPMVVTSEYPYGYSFNMGRLHYYYSEYVCNHIFNTIGANKIEFKISTLLGDDEDFNIEVDTDSRYSNDTVKSLILDVFDFKLDDFKYLMSTYDYKNDLLKPFESKPWMIKDRIEDLVIV